MLPKSRINRRQFIKRIGGAAVAAAGFPYVASLSGEVSPSEKITLGFIGMGMQGRGLLWAFLQQPSCRVVAVCDVDKQKLNRSLELVGENYGEKAVCAAYGDFRELLARKDIDGVVIATPDHWHSIMAIEACKAGKDVYCEKAMAMSVAEARQVVNEVRRCERIFQTGSMQRSDLKFHQACELVRNGYIGEVKSVRLFLGMMLGGTSFPIYPVGCDLPGEPTPDVLDWDMWLGPAPWRPYNSRIAPPMDVPGWPHWRDYEDYAGGLMTDWGAHHFDIAQWGLGMDASGPVEIYPENGKDIKMLTYKYANGTTVVRDDTMKYKSVEFTGTEGTVEVSREFIRTVPQSLIRQRIGVNDIRLYKSENHYTNWLDCICSRRNPICDAEIGCRSATVCHLGVIANRLGRPLKWDPVAERFINDAEADRFLSRPMRSPWKLA
jgi:predicted dehydrogenase